MSIHCQGHRAIQACARAVFASPSVQAQSADMTFFVTSRPGKGADLGGLEGADAQCQKLAQAGRRRHQDLARLSIDAGR